MSWLNYVLKDKYTPKTKRENKAYWKCALKDCTGRAVTVDESDARCTRNHNHSSDQADQLHISVLQLGFEKGMAQQDKRALL